jgi:hypothetical protein
MLSELEIRKVVSTPNTARGQDASSRVMKGQKNIEVQNQGARPQVEVIAGEVEDFCSERVSESTHLVPVMKRVPARFGAGGSSQFHDTRDLVDRRIFKKRPLDGEAYVGGCIAPCHGRLEEIDRIAVSIRMYEAAANALMLLGLGGQGLGEVATRGKKSAPRGSQAPNRALIVNVRLAEPTQASRDGTVRHGVPPQPADQEPARSRCPSTVRSAPT